MHLNSTKTWSELLRVLDQAMPMSNAGSGVSSGFGGSSQLRTLTFFKSEPLKANFVSAKNKSNFNGNYRQREE